MVGLSNLRGSHLSIVLVWFIHTVLQIYFHSFKIILQNWYLPIYYFSLMYMCKMWNTLNCVEVKKELDQMSLFKDILDNSEESIIIVSKYKYLEYVNNRFLLKFKTNIVKCATDRIMQLR